MVAGRPSIRADKATRQRSIAKVGIEGFTVALALEVTANGVTVNTVPPAC
jgi:NAD(P)-dependent dehydrogenase (short-subunit alcohol dehydrogenase family)